ncbi:LysR family transcriptional regulator [Burkholderia cepacia]|uniref:LysR family transcriptional regulator n=1 Tax=Burkholderia cepacia TaxID=292 RepID=UPI00075BC70E|nr:LysR family transcriptional regulator [Burkholderia cepacia]KVH74966.1 LysR family transcriptional regulator [Burkholderia cepacia]KWC57196.1 LysR family transcriptional regulator [Burkholderia cepacia]QFS41293.1 Bacterial regulatory helix-turn-helix protein, lysR family [Burkholderia cepacia]
MNWDDARVFLAVHRTGTLREAAAVLDIDQATVGRRLTALEKALGAKLFLKTSSGYVVTQVGEHSLQAAEAMEQAACEFERRVQGSDDRLEGEVRVTTTDSLAMDFVVPAIRELRRKCPAIHVILTTSVQVLNLTRRDADLAIRTVMPENPDLVRRKLAEWEVGLFASREYLDAHGEPAIGAAFEGHDLVVYQPGTTSNQGSALCGESMERGRIVAQVSSSLMLAASIRSGIGIGELPAYMAQDDDSLVRIWPDRTRAVPYQVWLVSHTDLNRTARVRAVTAEIAATFDRYR